MHDSLASDHVPVLQVMFVEHLEVVQGVVERVARYHYTECNVKQRNLLWLCKFTWYGHGGGEMH